MMSARVSTAGGAPNVEAEKEVEVDETVAPPTFEKAREHFDEFISKRIQEGKDTDKHRLAFAGEVQNADGSVKVRMTVVMNPSMNLCSE